VIKNGRARQLRSILKSFSCETTIAIGCSAHGAEILLIAIKASILSNWEQEHNMHRGSILATLNENAIREAVNFQMQLAWLARCDPC
jgi:hypothetical protein